MAFRAICQYRKYKETGAEPLELSHFIMIITSGHLHLSEIASHVLITIGGRRHGQMPNQYQ